MRLFDSIFKVFLLLAFLVYSDLAQGQSLNAIDKKAELYNAIKGKWRMRKDTNVVVVFQKDKIAILKYESLSISDTVNYRITADSKLCNGFGNDVLQFSETNNFSNSPCDFINAIDTGDSGILSITNFRGQLEIYDRIR